MKSWSDEPLVLTDVESGHWLLSGELSTRCQASSGLPVRKRLRWMSGALVRWQCRDSAGMSSQHMGCIGAVEYL